MPSLFEDDRPAITRMKALTTLLATLVEVVALELVALVITV
jgi:hypothetical protein